MSLDYNVTACTLLQETLSSQNREGSLPSTHTVTQAARATRHHMRWEASTAHGARHETGMTPQTAQTWNSVRRG